MIFSRTIIWVSNLFQNGWFLDGLVAQVFVAAQLLSVRERVAERQRYAAVKPAGPIPFTRWIIMRVIGAVCSTLAKPVPEKNIDIEIAKSVCGHNPIGAPTAVYISACIYHMFVWGLIEQCDWCVAQIICCICQPWKWGGTHRMNPRAYPPSYPTWRVYQQWIVKKP